MENGLDSDEKAYNILNELQIQLVFCLVHEASAAHISSK